MTTKISVYRNAARILGDARLATLTDDSPSRYAFDDAWDRTVDYVLTTAFWKFALKTVTPTDESTVEPLPGYSIVYVMPGDWLRTHAIFVQSNGAPLEAPIDCKHQLENIHTNLAPIFLRYISNDYADPETWPEHFASTVAARLAFDCAERITGNPAKIEQARAEWERSLSMAVGPDALPENPWLRFQLDGSMLAGLRWMLDETSWRFAIKTVELAGTASNVSSGYAYAADKPDDFGRVFHYYYAVGDSWQDIDFRDEDGRLHSAYQNTVLRYISTDGEDATTWTDGFRRALLAYLEFEEVKRNPNAPGAVLQARAMAWTEAYKNAKLKNDMSERPRYNNTGQLVQSRRGWRGGMSREQGWR